MDAITRSIERHRKKSEKKKRPQENAKVPWGCGMGWPEPKDFASREEYVKARQAADPDYAPGHDGKLWAIV